MLPNSYSAIIDSATRVLLITSSRIPIISFLTEITPDVARINSASYPNYIGKFPLAKVDPYRYPEWTWDGELRIFSPTPPEVLSDLLRWQSALMVKKGRLLSDIIQGITFIRYPSWSGIMLQEHVYITKKMQAQRFRDQNYAQMNILNFPYVLQYSDHSGLSPRAAADEILFKAQLDDDMLAKSELLRLKYFSLVKDADMDTVDVVAHNFWQEMYRI